MKPKRATNTEIIDAIIDVIDNCYGLPEDEDDLDDLKRQLLMALIGVGVA